MPKVELGKKKKKNRSIRRTEASGLCEIENLTGQSAPRFHHNTQIVCVCVCGYK